MADDAREKAEQAKAAKMAEIARQRDMISDAQSRVGKLEAEIADLNAFIAMWHQLTGIPAKPTAAERIESPAPEKRERPKNPSREFVVGIALDLIMDKGEPMARKELFDALADFGVEIRGKDPEMVLSTMLWRESDRIVRLPPYGYWPKDRPFPPAHYDPAIENLIGSAAQEPEGGEEAEDADD